MDRRPKYKSSNYYTLKKGTLGLSLDHGLLNMAPKVQETIKDWTLSKLKTSMLQRTPLRKWKRQTTEWDKIFASHLFNTYLYLIPYLIPTIYKFSYNI